LKAAFKIGESLFGAFGGDANYDFAGDSNYQAAIHNAKGGVYDSPSLSKYSGGVYDSPQFFAFAKGAGVFGEAGPEAIMPLSRGSDGKLGVKASGGSNVQISVNTIINSDGSSKTDTQSTGTNDTAFRQFSERMRQVAQEEIHRQMREGGNLWRVGVSA
jgi:phage-related minor tail protein